MCARLGAELVAAYEARVTHVIVRADPEDNSAERTLKFLYGVAGRKWIVSIEWVRQCLRQVRPPPPPPSTVHNRHSPRYSANMDHVLVDPFLNPT